MCNLLINTYVHLYMYSVFLNEKPDWLAYLSHSVGSICAATHLTSRNSLVIDTYALSIFSKQSRCVTHNRIFVTSDHPSHKICRAHCQ